MASNRGRDVEKASEVAGEHLRIPAIAGLDIEQGRSGPNQGPGIQLRWKA